MKGIQNFIFILLGTILILIGFALFNYIQWAVVFPLIIGGFAIFRGVSQWKGESKSDDKNIGSESETDEEDNKNDEDEPEDSEQNEADEEQNNEVKEKIEESPEILGIKVKPGIHTKILERVEPHVDALKSNLFWPFLPPKSPGKEESKTKKDFKYCKECGAKMPRIAKFCSNCGK